MTKEEALRVAPEHEFPFSLIAGGLLTFIS